VSAGGSPGPYDSDSPARDRSEHTFGTTEGDEPRPEIGRVGVVLACAAVLAGAEVLIAQGHVLAGQIADAILLVLLVNVDRIRGRARAERHGPAEIDPWVAAMRALAVVALINVVGIGLPLRAIPEIVREGLLALAIGVAAADAAPAVGVRLRRLLTMPAAGIGWTTVLGGLVLGLGAYLLGAPALASSDDPVGRILLAVAVAASAALVEEIVFRGLVQSTLQRLAGRVGALAAAGLFAFSYISFGSASLVLLMALAGLLFSHSVARSGVLGAALAGHVLLATGAAVVWPVLLGREPPGSPPEDATQLALAGAVLAGAAILGRRPVTPG
jgi:membrane protease YdiL (CAAX protease family)